MVAKQNVFILGTAYSGSTFLGHCLNAHSDVFFAGEVSGIFSEFSLGVQEAFCPLCEAQDLICPVWSKEFCDKVRQGGIGQTFSTIREKVEKPIVVDGSKFASWMELAIDHRADQTANRAVVIARSPFAFYHSVKRREDYSLELAAEEWVAVYNEILDSLASYNVPYIVVPFEKLLASPKKQLKKICHFLEMDFQETMLDFWQVAPHAIGGNAGAYMGFKEFAERGEFTTQEDEQQARAYQEQCFDVKKATGWQDHLSSQQIEAITQYPEVKQLCKKFGYPFGEKPVQRLLRKVIGK